MSLQPNFKAFERTIIKKSKCVLLKRFIFPHSGKRQMNSQSRFLLNIQKWSIFGIFELQLTWLTNEMQKQLIMLDVKNFMY